MAATRQPSGDLAVVNPELQFRVMAARTDPYLSSFVAAKAWQQARKELGVLRPPSDGLVMIAFLGGISFADRLAEHYDRDRTELLEKVVGADRNVLLIMTGLSPRNARTGAEWTIGNFIDEITSLLRAETSAYSTARRIDVPNDYRPRKPMS
jgi:hypothetical protein